MEVSSLMSFRRQDESSMHDKINVMTRFNWWRRRVGIPIKLVYAEDAETRALFSHDVFSYDRARLFLSRDNVRLYIKLKWNGAIMYVANFDGSMHTCYWNGAISWEFL